MLYNQELNLPVGTVIEFKENRKGIADKDFTEYWNILHSDGMVEENRVLTRDWGREFHDTCLVNFLVRSGHFAYRETGIITKELDKELSTIEQAARAMDKQMLTLSNKVSNLVLLYRDPSKPFEEYGSQDRVAYKVSPELYKLLSTEELAYDLSLRNWRESLLPVWKTVSLGQ